MGDGWIPAVGLFGSTIFQEGRGTVESGQLMGPSFPDSNPQIRPPAEGDDLLINPEVGIGFEVMAPRLTDGDWVPRFFAMAGVSGAFGPSRDLAKESVIEDLAVDPDIPGPKDMNVTGQGSRTRATLENLVVHASAGGAWPFEAFDRQLRLRLSIEYMRQEMHVEGAVRRAVCILGNGGTPQLCGATRGGGIGEFREIDLRSDKNQPLHGIGPGVELEVDAGRLGSIAPSLSIGVQAYRFVGDRDVKFYAQNEYGETARFTFEQKPWAVRAGVGVRFRWIPE